MPKKSAHHQVYTNKEGTTKSGAQSAHPAKQSKSKPRTNWKARALHCEEVIKIQNELARVTGEELRQYKIAYKRELDRAEFAENSVKELKLYNVNSERERKHWHDSYVNVKESRDFFHNKLLNRPTHWQRFKSYFMAGLRGE